MADLSKFPSISCSTHKGDELALKVVADLVPALWDLGLAWQESLAKSALEEADDKNILIKIESGRKAVKKAEKKGNDIFAKLNSYTINQLKNHALRFGVETAAATAQSRGSTWGFKSFVGSSHVESHEYEDVLSQEVLDAPICDVCIVQYGEAIPDGYYRLLKTPTNKKANLNSGSGGNPIYLCIKKDLTGKLAPIVNFIVIFPDRNEYVPPGYHVIQRGKTGCNINTGTGAERIYLCYKKDFLGNPVVDVQLILPSKSEEPPKSFNMIEKTISGVAANLNLGNSGPPIFFCYKQELMRLGCLLNEGDLDQRRKSFFLDIGERRGNDKGAKDVRSRSVSPVPRSRHGDMVKPHSLTDLEAAAKVSQPAVVAVLNAADNADIDNLSAPSEKVVAPPSVDKGAEALPEDDWLEITEEGDYIREAELVFIRRTQDVVDANGNLAPLKCRKALLAILAAVYVRQGLVSELAVAGLSKLLKETDFFENDLSSLPVPGTITMLDLTIESVCDRFDLSAEGDHDTLLQFLKICIQHSAARLSPISLQKMFRAISYLCNSYSTKSAWLINGLPMPLSEPGMDISPFRVLKELIWDTVAQVETVEIAHFLPECDSCFTPFVDMSKVSESYIDVRLIVEDLIDDAIDSVEVSRLCEAAFQTISKQSTSISSSSFWQLINNYSRKLFVDYPNRSAYVTLCAICKQAWFGIRTTASGDPIPRDLGSKLLALESISEFCHCAGEKMRMSKVMGYQIRRIVVPCIIYNVSYAMVDHKIFAKVLKIITALWKKWRRYLRIEFAILCEQLVFKVLQASVVQVRPIFQMIAVQEVINWFDQPHMLIEMFVNYDMDRKFVSHWNTFSYLVRSMCAIARRLSVETRAWQWKHGGANTAPEEANKVGITIRDVHSQALEEVSRMAKTLMDASGHAFLIIQDSEFRNRSLGAGAGWVEDEDADDHSGKKSSSPASRTNTNSKAGSVRSRRAAHEESEEIIKAAIKIYVEKGSLKKAVAFLISKDFMPDTPQEIANFLRVYKNSFDAEAIGEFLGEGGTNPIEEDYWSQIRFRYTRAVSFVEMDIEPALRLYLTNCGFRLPGEAQKINRFVEVFVKAFWQDNSGMEYCPFKHPDTVHLLSYAIIMLNTDLHRANTDKKRNKKMSKEEFISNLRGCDQGTDVEREYLVRIYDSIAAQPIELAVKAPSANTNSPHVSKNADENKGDEKKDDIVSTVLSNNSKLSPAEVRIAEEKKFIVEVCGSLRDSEDLLRSLASFSYRFQLTNIDMKISLDLVSFMFETVWFHFHAIVESIFNADNADMHAKFAALDILCYSLTSSIFLDLKMERMVFACLLKKFRVSCESMPHLLSNGRNIPDDSWFTDIENVNEDTALETIAKLHHLMVHIKDTIQESLNYELTKQVAAKFEKKAKILENNTFFVRQGDLNKVSRNGRATPYRFFLFSDHLIYAHMSMKKEYVVHASLSLTAMAAADVETDPSCCSFYLSHPIKSFVVVAESPVSKQHWLRDIKQTIVNCKKRELVANSGSLNRRMSMITRIESQQQTQLMEREASINFISPERNKTRRASYRAAEPIELSDVTDSEFTDAFHTVVPFSAPNSPLNVPRKGGNAGNGLHDSHSLLQASDLLRQDSGISMAESDEDVHVVVPKDPTPEQRALKQQAAMEEFKRIVAELPAKPLDGLFLAGSNFWKGLVTSRGSALSEATQTRLLALQKAARGSLQGPATTGESDTSNTHNGQEVADADQCKRDFLNLLFEAVPYWKYEQFL